MMNKRGQVLVLFVVMFPTIFLLIAFFLENMLITGEKNKLDNLNELVMEYTYQNISNVGLYDGVLDLILHNDKNVTVEFFEVSDNSFEISLTKNVDSFFGKIIGIKTYEVNSDYSANIESDKFIMNKK